MRKELRSDFTTRQTMQSASYELYYYSDAVMRKVPQHTHDYYEFYFFLEGDVEMQIGRACRLLRPGDTVILPPGMPHHAFPISHQEEGMNRPYRRFVLWLSREYLESLCRESADYGYLPDQAGQDRFYHHLEAGLFQEVQAKVMTVLEESHRTGYGHEALQSLYVKELLLTLTRFLYESEQIQQPGGEEGDRSFHALLAYIDQHLTEPLTLDQLASSFYLSKSYIVHTFKAQLGVSVHQYLLKKRLTACRCAILSGTSISQTYLTYGFHDYSNFYKAFRKEYGCSPREYRDLHVRS